MGRDGRGSASAVPWTAMNPGEELVVEMNFGAAVFDLSDKDHREKYRSLMALTRSVVSGQHKTPTVSVQDYSGKWVADGRFFVQVQWFQVGDPNKFIPAKPVSRVRSTSYSHDPEGA